jgi:electron transfer flavoprotein beta subunit
MPPIIVCFKWVIDEVYIRRAASGGLDFSSVDYKISDYDRNAIEEAVRLKSKFGGNVIAMTVGTPDATKGLKDALSRGPDQACFIADSSFGSLDSSQTAAILAEVIRSRFPDFGLVLCGEGSSDSYAQQVGARLAENLEIPCISFVQKMEPEGNRIVAERRVEDGIELVEATLPVLVTVLPEINVPRIPGVKDTLMASKKPVMTVKKEEIASIQAPRLQIIDLKAASMERRCEKFPADAEGVKGFVDAMRRKAVIP